MTRTVRDAALIMQVTSGYHERGSLPMREAPPDFLAALEPRTLSGTSVALIAGVIAAVIITIAGTAWYATRRWGG